MKCETMKKTINGKEYNIEPETDLWGANLRGADLCGANLRDANLWYANLLDANLLDANLLDANLLDANLSGANLRRADLSGANLRDADLRYANLSRANLRDANLSGANLLDANLRGADLSGADLRETSLDPAYHANGDVNGFDTVCTPSGQVWCKGYRTQNSPVMGGNDYDVGQWYSAPYFSICQYTECHPGLYVRPEKEDGDITVWFFAHDCHRAGNKWRVRHFFVEG